MLSVMFSILSRYNTQDQQKSGMKPRASPAVVLYVYTYISNKNALL